MAIHGIHHKKTVQKKLSSRYILVPLFIVCLFLIHGTWSAYKKYVKSIELKELSEKELRDLVIREQKLKKDIELLKTDFGKEVELRNKFGLVKNDEKLIVLVDEAQSTENPILELTLWDKITGFLKGLF